jgi:hypothetical protein
MDITSKLERHPMKTSQLNPTPSGVLGTMAKLIRLADVEWSHWLHPTNNVKARRNLTVYLQMGCPKIDSNGGIVTPALPEGEELARLILGDDFLSPEDMAKEYGWSYSDDQMENFAETLPDFETLMWLKSNGSLLQATPPSEMNFLQVRDLYNQVFYRKKKGRFAESQNTFSCGNVVKAGEWLMVRKEPYPDSRKKTWGEQTKLLSKDEHVSNAPEMAYAVTAYYKVRDVYLLKGVYVRTSSADADGYRVHVGHSAADGLLAHYRNSDDGGRYNDIGVASSRKNLDCLNT